MLTKIQQKALNEIKSTINYWKNFQIHDKSLDPLYSVVIENAQNNICHIMRHLKTLEKLQEEGYIQILEDRSGYYNRIYKVKLLKED